MALGKRAVASGLGDFQSDKSNNCNRRSGFTVQNTVESPETDGITVEERSLSEYESGFLAGVFAARAIEIPSEEDFREAMELLVLQGRNFDP